MGGNTIEEKINLDLSGGRSERLAYWYLVDRGYICKAGMIYHPEGELHNETEQESRAINYLCSEWDYGFHMGEPKRPS